MARRRGFSEKYSLIAYAVEDMHNRWFEETQEAYYLDVKNLKEVNLDQDAALDLLDIAIDKTRDHESFLLTVSKAASTIGDKAHWGENYQDKLDDAIDTREHLENKIKEFGDVPSYWERKHKRRIEQEIKKNLENIISLAEEMSDYDVSMITKDNVGKYGTVVLYLQDARRILDGIGQ